MPRACRDVKFESRLASPCFRQPARTDVYQRLTELQGKKKIVPVRYAAQNSGAQNGSRLRQVRLMRQRNGCFEGDLSADF